MRFVLGLCLVMASCASANAAQRWHNNSRQAIPRPGQAITPSYITPSGVRIYRDDSVPGGLRLITMILLPTMIHPGLAAADVQLTHA